LLFVFLLLWVLVGGGGGVGGDLLPVVRIYLFE